MQKLPDESWVDRLIRENPKAYAQARLVMDATDALRLAIEDSGVGHRELSRRAGTNHSTLCGVLGEYPNPTLKTLASFADALDMRFEIQLTPKSKAGQALGEA